MRTLAAILILGLCARSAAAQTIDVTTEAELRGAILVTHSGGAIHFQADITLTAELPAIQQNITIDGNGHTLSGGGAFRGFFVYTGEVTIRHLTIENMSACGGDGGAGDDDNFFTGGRECASSAREAVAAPDLAGHCSWPRART